MNRVMIIGCCGSGKSTLSKKLQKLTGLPLFHLDQYYWKENWTETPKDQWEPIVEFLASNDEWIIDGNYGGTWKCRFDRADTVIYLDYNTIKCLYRVTKRVIKYHGQVRPDMPNGCKERFDLDFFHYVATYNLMRRKSTLARLEALDKSIKVVVLKSDKEIDFYLSGL